MFKRSLHSLPLGSCLVVVVVCIAVTQALPQLGNVVPVGFRTFSDELEACTHLRNFLPLELEKAARCSKYTHLLFAYRRDGAKFNYQSMIKIARMNPEQTKLDLKGMRAGSDKNLFRSMLEKFILQEHQVNDALVEIHDCLRDKYLFNDNPIRQLLKRKELANTIHQYRDIVGQSAWMLVDKPYTGELTLDQLTEPVKNALVRWFGMDTLTDVFKTPEASNVASDNQEPEEDQNMYSANSPGQTPHEVPNDENLGEIYGAIIEAHDHMPEDMQLKERCHVYNKLMEVNPSALNDEQLLEKIVSEAKQEATQRPEGEYVPKESMDNFIDVVKTFDPLEGKYAWDDVMGCVEEQAKSEKRAQAYLQSDDFAQILKYVEEKSSELPPVNEEQPVTPKTEVDDKPSN